MTPSRRRLALFLAVLGGALALLAFGVFPQEPLRRLVERRLRAAIGPGAHIARLTVFPAGLRADIGGLVLDGPGYRLEVDRARVTVSRAILVSPGINLRALDADGVRLVLRPSASTDSGGGFEGPIMVRSLSLTRGTLRYEGPEAAYAIEGITAHGSLGTGALELTAGGGRVDGRRKLALGPARARIVLSPLLALRLEALEAGLARSRINASGDLGRVSKLAPDLAFTAHLDLAELAPLVDVGAAAGELEAKGTLAFPDGSLRVEAGLSGTGLHMRQVPVDQLRLEGAFDVRRGSQARLSATLLGGTFTAQATHAAHVLNARARLSSLALDRLHGLGLSPAPGLAGVASGELTAEGDLRRSVNVSSRIDAAGDVSGLAFRAELRADGPVALPDPNPDLDWVVSAALDGPATGVLRTARLEATGTLRGRAPDLAGRLHGMAELSAPKPVAVALEANVAARGSRWNGDLRVDGLGGPLALTAEADGGRFERLEARATGIELARLAGSVSGTASLDMRASGLLAAPTGSGLIELSDLSWRGVALGAARAELLARGGHMSAAIAMPALSLSGDLALAAGPRAVLDGTLHLARTDLTTFAPLLPAGRPLAGELTGRVAFELPLGEPARGVARAEIEELQASSGEWSARAAQPFTVRFEAGRFEARDLKLEGEGIVLSASGHAGLRPEAGLDLRILASARLGELSLPAGWSAAGDAAVDLRLMGTRRQPQGSGFAELHGVTLDASGLPALTLAEARIELDRGAIALPPTSVGVGGGELRLEARLPLAALLPDAGQPPRMTAEAVRIRAEWSGVETTRLLPAEAGKATVEAILSGRAELTGPRLALSELSGLVEVPQQQARLGDVDVTLAPFRLELQRGRLKTEGIELQASGGTLRVGGELDLPRRQLDATARGAIELRALSPFLSETALSGHADVDLAARGPWSAPRASGSLTVRDASLRMRGLPQALTQLQGRIEFENGLARLEQATAVFGGGAVTVAGSARIAEPISVEVTLTGRDLGLSYPPGMRSRLDADLTLAGSPGAFRLAGSVRALRGLYDLDVVFEEALFASATRYQESPALRAIALDLRVETANPVVVRNNLVQLQATGRLDVRGDMDTPSPVGTLQIASGGKVFLQGREFTIQSGGLSYGGSWDPTLNITAQDLIEGQSESGVPSSYTVSVGLTGSLERPNLVLRAEPSLSEAQVVSLIATGRTDSENPALKMVVGGQAAALLAGRFTRRLRDLGFDEVTLRPELVAREGEEATTGARFTFGKRLGSRVNVIYSLSLQDPEGRFVQLEVGPWHGVSAYGQRNDLGVETFGVGQRFGFGGPKRPTAAADERRRVREVSLTGDRPLEPDALKQAIKTRPGDKKSIWNLQDDADRLRKRLIDLGYIEAEVSSRLDGDTAVFDVRAGPRYAWSVEGMPDAPDLESQLRKSLFEEEALENGRARLLSEARARGHLRAAVTTEVKDQDGVRRLLFRVALGLRYSDIRLSFPGADALDEGRLRDAAGGPGRVLTEPDAALADLRKAYREARVLAPEIDTPRVEEHGTTVHIEVTVREGPRARLAAVRFEGTTLGEELLRQRVNLQTGRVFDELELADAVDRLRELYFRNGYPSVRIRPVANEVPPDVEVVFRVTEGERLEVGGVEIQGLTRTRESLVRRQVNLRPGQPLDPRRLVRLERRLLDLGVFAQASATFESAQPAPIKLALTEGDRLVARYDLRYSDEDLGSALGDAEVRNLLGVGLNLGARYQIGARIEQQQGTLSVPSPFGRGRFTLSVGRRLEEEPPPSDEPETLEVREDERSFQFQYNMRLRERTELLLGLRRRRTYITVPELPLLNNVTNVAGVDLSLVRDTRDNALDTRRGRFLSVTLELAPEAIGSDGDFMKGFAQAFLTRRIGRDLYWAQGYRLGLAHVFSQKPLIEDEGFRAGGANSLRGYTEDDITGPIEPFGAQAVVIVNQELRYMHRSGLGAAGFYDGGNVFATIQDLHLDLRHTLGLGLRWNSPVGLLRLDAGFPLDRQPQEKRMRYFFSLGQAF